MKRLALKNLLLLVEALTWAESRLGSKKPSLNSQQRADLAKRLTDADKLCSSMALRLSVVQVAKVRAELRHEPFRAPYLRDRIRELRKRIEDEIGTRFTFFLAPADEQMFSDEKPFGQEVYDAFPDARPDISEAGSCLV